ncbi:MAG: cell division protein FtsZ [Proteobacteria bacterium]|nr:cell division protein FtsZ [Pseudomonadota bacterium]
MEFEFVDYQSSARIMVIGIGGAGGNAINNMIHSGLEGVGFLAANTDLQDLSASNASIKLQLGMELTRGRGCGADPEVGRQAALEDVDRIKEVLAEAEMVFITAGMGGGTGTGGAPVVAECLKELENPPLTVAVVTKPFHFEGKRRLMHAEAGIELLKEYADTIITIPNDRLLAMAPRGFPIRDAFKLADDVLLQAVKGVSDLILLPGLINVDFRDAQKIMSNKGLALMGTGIASGPDRAVQAAQQAISSPLLEDISIKGATGILINIASSDNNVTLEEVDEACTLIRNEAGSDDDMIIFGVAWDETLEDNMRITVIATGIGQEPKQRLEEEKKTLRLANLDEVARRPDVWERSPRNRKEARPQDRLQGFEAPQYNNKYESFIFEGEDLEKPTFMRRKAD